MTRSLARGFYNQIQVEEVLRDGNGRIGRSFDLVNRTLQKTGELVGVVVAEPGASVVDFNVDRGIPGALNLIMDPDERLRNNPYTTFVKPWFWIEMPDGGWAKYEMGVYQITKPARDITYRGTERWTFNGLPDLTFILDSDGPGRDGIHVAANTNITDIVRLVHAYNLSQDLSGITPSDAVMSEAKTWLYLTPRSEPYQARQRFESQLATLKGRQKRGEPLREGEWSYEDSIGLTLVALAAAKVFAPDNDNSPVTWYRFLTALQEGIGYVPPFYDAVGRPRADPIKDLTRDEPTIFYETDSKSVIEKVTITPEQAGWFNRVHARASNSDGLYAEAELDANHIWPNHPLAQKNVGFYRTDYFDDSVAETEAALEWRAVGRLQDDLSIMQTVQMTTAAWPAHEAYDVVHLKITDDPELASGAIFQERMWALDLYTGKMEHGLRRLYR